MRAAPGSEVDTSLMDTVMLFLSGSFTKPSGAYRAINLHPILDQSRTTNKDNRTSTRRMMLSPPRTAHSSLTTQTTSSPRVNKLTRCSRPAPPDAQPGASPCGRPSRLWAAQGGLQSDLRSLPARRGKLCTQIGAATGD